MKKKLLWGLAVGAGLGLSLLIAGQTIPKAGLPVLTTSAGQSTDVTTLNIVLDEAAIAYDYCDVPPPRWWPTASDSAGGNRDPDSTSRLRPTWPKSRPERPTRRSFSPSAPASKAWGRRG